ncbi:pleckstrin homology-like domain family A member 1 [Schistocerca serialis cubense]|uniref:pleckstrin homology-like domain family A member 1 n=1 Tax=Schistocerca serialis cubense TaxID=2023355 RepID=UPI00214E67B3|nr:pleckstrin homology-like domain family A member 1 [Schistocerca serialis cubense]
MKPKRLPTTSTRAYKMQLIRSSTAAVKPQPTPPLLLTTAALQYQQTAKLRRTHLTPHLILHLTPHPTPHLTPHPTPHLTPRLTLHPTPHLIPHLTPHLTLHLTPAPHKETGWRVKVRLRASEHEEVHRTTSIPVFMALL